MSIRQNTYVQIAALATFLLVVTFAVAAAYGTATETDPAPGRAVTYRTALLDARIEARTAMWVRATNEHHLAASVELLAVADRVAAEKAHAATHATRTPAVRARRVPVSTPGSGRCGGNLPPCYVMQRESGGSLTAENPASTASGKWQFLAGTWGGWGGYSTAGQAPESVQDARAAQLWAGGAGCSHWSAC